MGLSNRDKMSTSLSGDARGIFCQSLKLIHPAVWEEMRNRYTDTQTEGARSHNKNIDDLSNNNLKSSFFHNEKLKNTIHTSKAQCQVHVIFQMQSLVEYD